MHTIFVDPSLLERLDRLEQETEFVDSSGRRIGRFVPEPGDHRTDSRSFDPPLESDPALRAAAVERLIRSWDDHPLSPDAPRLTRDEMHERR